MVRRVARSIEEGRNSRYQKAMGTTVSVESADIVRKLQSQESFEGIPVDELVWLSTRGAMRQYETGGMIRAAGEGIEFLWICLEGRVVIDVDRGAGPRRAFEWGPGDVGGLLPYSRMATSPGNAYAIERTAALVVDREYFPELTRECPNFTAHTVHIMLDRARTFNTSDLHDEKMVSLGRLAAGLAHELNNPASATVSAARTLAQEIVEADRSARALGAAGLTEAQVHEIERVREICLANSVDIRRSLSERMAREEEILEWLERRGADPNHAAPLAETPVSLETLDLLAETVEGPALEAGLNWIATGCTTRALAQDIEKSAHRIHDLVSAVKRFTYMDRPSGPEIVDLADGLRDTVAVVRSRAREKSANITLEVEPGLPQIRGTGGELNQIWLNLLDNALHAISESGHIEVSARRELDQVVVRVVDDGHGIPPKILGVIFDPFFTTKEPGEGTGLGLDIARNIVRRHGGEIQVETRTGETEFRVRLPVA